MSPAPSRYERRERGLDHDRSPAPAQRRRRRHRGRAARGVSCASRPTRMRARWCSPARGGVAFCAGADLKATETIGGRLTRARGPDGLHAPDPVQADDRRDLGLLSGGRARAGAVVRSADRDRGLDARLPRAPLGRAADRRRHAAAAADRRPRTRARPDPHRSDDRAARGARDGPADRGRAVGRATSSARSRSPRGSPRSPSARCSPIAAPRSRASACRSREGLALEAAAGPEVFEEGARGAARFAAGEGRGGGGRRSVTRRRLIPICSPDSGLLRDRSDRLHRATPDRAAAQPAPGQGVRARAQELDGRLDDLVERWSGLAGASGAKRVQPVVGDLRSPLLGVEQEQVPSCAGRSPTSSTSPRSTT